MIAFDGYLFACSAHTLGLAIDSGGGDLGKTVLNSMFPADAIKDMFESMPVSFSVAELDTIIGKYGMDFVKHKSDQVA